MVALINCLVLFSTVSIITLLIKIMTFTVPGFLDIRISTHSIRS